MPGTGYSVATSAQLLGAKLAQRRNIEHIYFAHMQAAEEQYRERGEPKRRAEVRRVRFAESDTTSESTAVRSSTAGAYTAAASPSGASGTKNQDFETLPLAHDVGTAKPITQLDTSSTGLRRSNTVPTRGCAGRRKGEPVTKIYFSPVEDANGSRIGFSSPLLTPAAPNSPPVSSPSPLSGAKKVSTTSESTGAEGPQEAKIILPADQLDHIVAALANAPMVQQHVRKQWWDGNDDINAGRDGDEDEQNAETLISAQASTMSLRTALAKTEPLCSESDTPSLTSGSTAASASSSSLEEEEGLYSLPNQGFAIYQKYDADEAPRMVMGENKYFTQQAPHPTKTQHVGPTGKRNPTFASMALCDPNVSGSPALFTSASSGEGWKAGECTFVGLPYGVSCASELRIEPADADDGRERRRVLLRSTSRVLSRYHHHSRDPKQKRKQTSHLLTMDLDVTDLFTHVAVAELAVHAGISPSTITLPPSPSSSAPPAPHESPVDWLLLADELQTHLLISESLPAISALTPQTCSMQTLSLLSRLSRLREQVQEFLVVEVTAVRADGKAARVGVPGASQALERKMGIGGREEARTVREGVVEAVARGAWACGGGEFEGVIGEGEQRRKVVGVPLREGMGRDARVWVCFLRDGCDL